MYIDSNAVCTTRIELSMYRTGYAGQYGRGVYGLNNNGYMSSHSNKSDDGNYIGIPGKRGDLTVDIDPSTGKLTFAQMGKVIITQQTSINPSSPAFHFFAAMGPQGQASIVGK